MCSVLSVNSGSAASSASQAWVNSVRSASRHWVFARSATEIAGRSIGRIRRTRRSTAPSSIISPVVGTCTAARPDLR